MKAQFNYRKQTIRKSRIWIEHGYAMQWANSLLGIPNRKAGHWSEYGQTSVKDT